MSGRDHPDRVLVLLEKEAGDREWKTTFCFLFLFWLVVFVVVVVVVVFCCCLSVLFFLPDLCMVFHYCSSSRPFSAKPGSCFPKV